MPANETRLNAASARPLTLAAYAAFLPIGIVNVILGPMLPTLSARWSMNYSQAGGLFPAQFWASTATVALSGAFVSRWGFRFAMKLGMLLIAIAVALLLLGSKVQGFICIAAIGAGLGLAVPPSNLLVAEVNPERRSAALNTLNFSWSMGAVASPFLVAAAVKRMQVPLMLESVAALMALVAVGIALMPAWVVEPSVSKDAADRPSIEWAHGALPVLGALFFVYVGTETGFGGWVASYSKNSGNLSSAVSALTASFFYAALTLGRWLAPLALRRIDEVRLAKGGLVIACIGMAMMVLSHTLAAIIVSTGLAGLGLSSVYPITISLLSREFGSAASRVGSLMFTLANLGGGVIPWLVGISSSQFGSLKAGLILPLSGCVVMYVLYLRKWQAPAGLLRT
jgi:fucose permease